MIPARCQQRSITASKNLQNGLQYLIKCTIELVPIDQFRLVTGVK